MQALIRDNYGTPDVLRIAEVDRPEVGDDDVLIRVHASSINAGDRLLLRGEPYLLRLVAGLFRPKRQGSGQDVAGTVEAVGSAVTDFEPGDAVYGEVTFGATWAEYAVARAATLARKPRNLSFDEAACMPVSAMTALEAVRDQGRVQPEQSVLINGASGGVGSFAVQIAVALGAEVTAVCSGLNAEQARQLGASHVVDYTREDFTQTSTRYDVLIDVAGSRTLAECRSVLKPGGTYVAVGGPVGKTGLGFVGKLLRQTVTGWFVPQRLTSFVTAPSRESLDALTELAEAEQITAIFARRVALADVPDAIRALDAGRERGKVVVGIC